MNEEVVFKEFLDNVEAFSYSYIETYAYQESLLCRSELLLVRRLMEILVNGLKNKYGSGDLVPKKDLLQELNCIHNGYINKNLDRLSNCHLYTILHFFLILCIGVFCIFANFCIASSFVSGCIVAVNL